MHWKVPACLPILLQYFLRFKERQEEDQRLSLLSLGICETTEPNLNGMSAKCTDPLALNVFFPCYLWLKRALQICHSLFGTRIRHFNLAPGCSE